MYVPREKGGGGDGDMEVNELRPLVRVFDNELIGRRRRRRRRRRRHI